MRASIVTTGIACFLGGLVVPTLIAQSKRPTWSLDLVRDKPTRDAAGTLLDGALQLAGNGSWERIAVGRAWYLGGDKARGQEIFDSVTTRRGVEASDWIRLGRVYSEAGEWEKAQAAYEKATAMDAGDDSVLLEYGAYANVHKDRAKAESLFDRALKESPREFWHWVGAGGSYLGVRPQ